MISSQCHRLFLPEVGLFASADHTLYSLLFAQVIIEKGILGDRTGAALQWGDPNRRPEILHLPQGQGIRLVARPGGPR